MSDVLIIVFNSFVLYLLCLLITKKFFKNSCLDCEFVPVHNAITVCFILYGNMRFLLCGHSTSIA